MDFGSPLHRPRRLRQSPLWREMLAEVAVQPQHLMQAYFVVGGTNRREPIASMPGIDRLSIDLLRRQVAADWALGLRQVLLFGVPEPAHKDSQGSAASAADAVVSGAVCALRADLGAELLIATDVCLCAYTDHGHCGVLRRGRVDNDASLPQLSAMALAHAQAGADIVAPSDMMDGRIVHMRHLLDAQGLTEVAIMAYTCKYASAYYGPFRDAAACSPGEGDRLSYQMDPRNRREAVREVELDIAEGADILLVKPALAYLDIVATVRARSALPVACYNVSGEYSMVKAAAQAGWIDEAALVRENFLAMRRAGADLIVTYHARDALAGGWLAHGQ